MTKSGIYTDVGELLPIYGKRTDKNNEDVLLTILQVVYNAILYRIAFLPLLSF